MTTTQRRLIGIVGRAGSGKDTLATMLREEAAASLLAFADPFKVFVRDVFNFDHETLWGPSALRNQPDPRYGAASFGRLARIGAWFRRHSIYVNRKDAILRFYQARFEFIESLFGPGWWRDPHTDTANASLTRWYDNVIAQPVVTPRFALQTIGDWGREIDPLLWVNHTMERVADTNAPVIVITDVRQPNEASAVRAVGGELWKVIRGTAKTQNAVAEVQRAGVKNHNSEAQIDGLHMDALVTRRVYNDGSLGELREHVRYGLKNRGW